MLPSTDGYTLWFTQCLLCYRLVGKWRLCGLGRLLRRQRLEADPIVDYLPERFSRERHVRVEQRLEVRQPLLEHFSKPPLLELAGKLCGKAAACLATIRFAAEKVVDVRQAALVALSLQVVQTPLRISGRRVHFIPACDASLAKRGDDMFSLSHTMARSTRSYPLGWSKKSISSSGPGTIFRYVASRIETVANP